MTFHYEIIDAYDDELLEECYQLGVQNPIPEAKTCSAYPYPLKGQIAEWIERPDVYYVAFYEDPADLRVLMAFMQDGRVVWGVGKAYDPPDAPMSSPKGIEFGQFMFDSMRTICQNGLTIKNMNNDAMVPFYEQAGVEIQ